MTFATITSKGQTTIPKSVRDAAGLRAGDRIHFAVLPDGTIIVRAKTRSIRDVARQAAGPPARHGRPDESLAAAGPLLGIDTNVLVRLLVLDDRAQSRRARQLVQQALDQ